MIVELGGKPVRKTSDLFAAMERRKVGDAVKVVVLREGERVEVEVTLGQVE